jgi:hypothetical protein
MPDMWEAEGYRFNQFRCIFSATVCTTSWRPSDRPHPETCNPLPTQVNLTEQAKAAPTGTPPASWRSAVPRR